MAPRKKDKQRADESPPPQQLRIDDVAEQDHADRAADSEPAAEPSAAVAGPGVQASVQQLQSKKQEEQPKGPTSITRAEAAKNLERGNLVWVKGKPYYWLGVDAHDPRMGRVTNQARARPQRVRIADVEPVLKRRVRVAGLVDDPRVSRVHAPALKDDDPLPMTPAEEVTVDLQPREADTDNIKQLVADGPLCVGQLHPVTTKETKKQEKKYRKDPPPGMPFTFPGIKQPVYRGEPVWYRNKPYRYAGQDLSLDKSVRLFNAGSKTTASIDDVEPVRNQWVTWKHPDPKGKGNDAKGKGKGKDDKGKEPAKTRAYLRVTSIENDQQKRDDPPKSWTNVNTLKTTVRSGSNTWDTNLTELNSTSGNFSRMLSFFTDRDFDEGMAGHEQRLKGQGSTVAIGLDAAQSVPGMLLDAGEKATGPLMPNPDQDFQGQDAQIDAENDALEALGEDRDVEAEKMLGPEASLLGNTLAAEFSAGTAAFAAIGDLSGLVKSIRKGEPLKEEQLVGLATNSSNVGVNLAGAGLGLASFFTGESQGGVLGSTSTGLNGVADAFSLLGTMPGLCKTVYSGLKDVKTELFGKKDLAGALRTAYAPTVATLKSLLNITMTGVSAARWICAAFGKASDFVGEFPIIGSAISIAATLFDTLVTAIDHIIITIKAVRRAIAQDQHLTEEKQLRAEKIVADVDRIVGDPAFADRAGPASSSADARAPRGGIDDKAHDDLDEYMNRLATMRFVRDLETLGVKTGRIAVNVVKIGADVTKIVSVAGAAPSSGASVAMYLAGTGVSAGATITNMAVPFARERIDQVVHMTRRKDEGVLNKAAANATNLTKLLQHSDGDALARRLHHLDRVFDLDIDDLQRLLDTAEAGDSNAGIRALQYYLFMRFWAVDSWK